MQPRRDDAMQWALPVLAWMGGLSVLQQCERLPRGGEWGLLLAFLVALAWAATRSRLALLCAAALLAFMQGAWRADMRLAEVLPEAWEGRDVLLVGRVDSLPSAVLGQGGAPGWRFEFAVAQAHAGPTPQDPPLVLPRRLLLLAYGPPGGAAPRLLAGERWQWLARLKRPHGLMNPHQGLDYELWLFEQGLRATGVVRAEGMLRLEAAPAWSLDGWRQRLRDSLYRHVADRDRAGVLAGLSLGDQSAISREDWGLFRDTGVAHLLAVSGTHVTMFAWAAQWLVAALWRRHGKLCLRLPAPRAAMWAGVLAALAYALFSGWGVPAQRTVWMLATLAVLRQAGLRWPWPLNLLAAALVVTVVDPWAISQAGFWLSFAAVALLMASGAPAGAGLRDLLRTQWTATLGLSPLSLVFFGQISVVGLLANLLAIPLVSVVIAPLALAGALLPALWWPAELAVQGMMAALRWLAGWSWAVWFAPAAPGWAQAAGLAGGALLVMPLPWRLRLCGLGLLAPLLAPAPPRPAAGEFELLAADVGQGTAVLVRTASHALLYDAGPQYGAQTDAGQRVLLPLLRHLGLGRLDLLVLSHRDMDHVGGAASLLKAMPIGELRSSLEDGHPLRAGLPHRRCERGQQWRWDGVLFELLHPLPADHDAAAARSNALSCVLRISSAAGRSALLTGDIEAAQEQQLAPTLARSDLLLVPHHGSKTSSSDALLAAVSPTLAFAQAGYRNRFGHPALPVLARYQAHGIALRTSPDCGALRWRSDGGWDCRRELGRRYWHAPPAGPVELQGPPAHEKGQPEGWP